jgi:homocysteine S-methyltransferase
VTLPADPAREPRPGDPITVLDGGLATELEARGHDLSDRLWSARLLASDPVAIEDVHLAYLRAGARVVTTATYQASIEGFAAAGIERDAALALIRRGVELAVRARDRFVAEERAAGRDPGRLLVAGSVGPYGAMLADGSEYRGDYDPGREGFQAFHRPRIEALVEAGADVLGIETIPTIREAAVLVELADEAGIPAWLSYSCRDGASTSAGEPFEAAVALANAHDAVVAVGVNCTAPRHLPALLELAAIATDKDLVAYPNRGDRWDAVRRAWNDEPAEAWNARDVASWTTYGARWLGGCCGTGPADIARLLAALG